jgi:hypothetical protein
MLSSPPFVHQVETTRLLLDAGSDPNRVERDRDSPLSTAVWYRKLGLSFSVSYLFSSLFLLTVPCSEHIQLLCERGARNLTEAEYESRLTNDPYFAGSSPDITILFALFRAKRGAEDEYILRNPRLLSCRVLTLDDFPLLEPVLDWQKSRFEQHYYCTRSPEQQVFSSTSDTGLIHRDVSPRAFLLSNMFFSALRAANYTAARALLGLGAHVDQVDLDGLLPISKCSVFFPLPFR